MRRVRYSVASSLDGYIAGPKGEADWIIMDPEIDFGAVFREFDTVLVGRRTFVSTGGADSTMPGMKSFVVSRTLRQQDFKKITIVGEDLAAVVKELKESKGKDIWLFGGGSLFRSLAEMGLVDTVEVAMIPVLLGGGIPLFPGPSDRIPLKLTSHKVYKTGIVSLEYSLA